MQEAAQICAPITKACEGLRLRVYKCPAGVWTQGYGTVYKPGGVKVKQTDPPITPQIAEHWLMHELVGTYMVGVLKYAPNLIKYPLILAAITDWAYNCGIPRFRASTLRRVLVEEDWQRAIQELKKWVRGGGRVLPGLVKRRALEAALIMRQISEEEED